MIQFLLTTRRLFGDPQFRSLLLLVVLTLVGGTIFYSLQEGWNVVDAFYFSAITLTTVGLGDLSQVADVVFVVHGSTTHRQASAWYTTDDNSRPTVSLTYGGVVSQHRRFASFPGSCTLPVTVPCRLSAAITPLHEFCHAASDFNNGKVNDPRRRGPSLRPLSICSTYNTTGTILLRWATPQSRTGLRSGAGSQRYYTTIRVGPLTGGL
jgi:hypothetical protein